VSEKAPRVRISLVLVLVAALGCNPAPASPAPPGSPTTSVGLSPSPQPTPTPSPSASPTPSPTIDPLEAAVDDSLAVMSDSEKVGQLILAGYSGANGVEAAAELVGELQVGGVILFADNVQSPDHAVAVTTAFRSASDGIEPLIAIDHEGGEVIRMGPPVTQLPDAWTIGETGDPELAREAGRVAGEELLAMGIGVDLAPVLDVNDEPDNPVIGRRAFGADPQLVTEMGLAFADGLEPTGVVATGKHFPGHGHTTVDSHYALPVVDRTRRQLERIDFVPFQAAVDAGIEVIMTAHVVYTALDRREPATLSRPILTGILREQMGFDGVVVTDSLSMEAITEQRSRGEAAVVAILAGADMVLIPDDVAGVRTALLTALRSGRLPAERLDASVRRILRLKLGHADAWSQRPPLSVVGSKEHQAVVQRILDAAGATSAAR
jgi:beta-N-acetylhexosaminidase